MDSSSSASEPSGQIFDGVVDIGKFSATINDLIRFYFSKNIRKNIDTGQHKCIE